MSRNVKLGLIQMTCTDDKQSNIDKAVANIESLARSVAQIICTQELYQTPYFCQVMDDQVFKLAQEIHVESEIIRNLGSLAADLKVVLIAGLFEKRAAGLYHNTAVVIDADGTYLGKYRKMHIPQDPGYTEKYYFTPGDLGYQVFRTKYADIGVLICWDQWFPEAARLTAMSGAELIFCPTAIGFDPDNKSAEEREESHAAWQIVQQGHAAANACYLAAINRVGFEKSPDSNGGIQFWGGSFVANPSGQLLEKASTEEEENLLCSIDLSRIEEIRNISSYPFRDRRVDSYQDLTALYSD
ncbi:MAG: carbon-nitrogen hydrolase [Anaerolineales bacterium]|nr:carbon-nitrogen hydrolase [Anaerolineales bacterium]